MVEREGTSSKARMRTVVLPWASADPALQACRPKRRCRNESTKCGQRRSVTSPLRVLRRRARPFFDRLRERATEIAAELERVVGTPRGANRGTSTRTRSAEARTVGGDAENGEQ